MDGVTEARASAHHHARAHQTDDMSFTTVRLAVVAMGGRARVG